MHPALRLRQVNRPAAAAGLCEWEEKEHLWRRKIVSRKRLDGLGAVFYMMYSILLTFAAGQ